MTNLVFFLIFLAIPAPGDLPILIIWFLAIAIRNELDEQAAIAWQKRRGEEIARAYNRGVAHGLGLGELRVKDDFDAFLTQRRHARRAAEKAH